MGTMVTASDVKPLVPIRRLAARLGATLHRPIPHLFVGLALALLAVTTLQATAGAADNSEHSCNPDEPASFRTSEYRATVPCTLAGARVISTHGLRDLVERGTVLLIDVFPAPRQPDAIRSDDEHLWLAPTRNTIAGAVWLPNIGFGVLPVEEEIYFRSNLERLTGGEKTRTVVFFCEADCWMSWNAARRALIWGYESVVWYPQGTDGWTEAGFALVEVAEVERGSGN